MHRAVLVTAALAMLCPPLQAQQDSLLRPGARVRVEVRLEFRDPVVGTLVAMPPGVFSIARGGERTDTIDIPVSLIRKVEVSRGQYSRSQGVRRGLATGLAAGVAVGFLLGRRRRKSPAVAEDLQAALARLLS